MKKICKHFLLTAFFIIFYFCCNAQNKIIGNFPLMAGAKLNLIGFENMGIYTIDSTEVNAQGEFSLNYSSKDFGMGYIMAEDQKIYFLVLANENIRLKGELISIPESIQIISGTEQKIFESYARQHSKRQQVESAWQYLQNIYWTDTNLRWPSKMKKTILLEQQRIAKEDKDYLKNLDPNSFVYWYLPTRKLLSDVDAIVKSRPMQIPATIAAFRALNYNEAKLYKSGLLKDALESHFWLIENMGAPLDTVYKEMKISIDYLIPNLLSNEAHLNEVTKFLFNLFEKHSLFDASEYLAIKLLTQNSCVINNDFARQLEMYRAMKIGNIAPNIIFENSTKPVKQLADLKSEYKLIVFGASWCSKCKEEIPKLLPYYETWKNKYQLDIIFVSLDTDLSSFQTFAKDFPWVSSCELKSWESKAVKDYFVFGTPTIYLLDKDDKIILKPNSEKQVQAWLETK
jgi:thiol-disulfide isomerase/thioredoxin